MKNSITLLVVDDEALVRQLVEKILLKEGYVVLTAGDGAEALEMLKHEKIDIVVSDIKMPNMNGFELLQTAKKAHPSLAFVIMTGFGDTYSVKDALLLGADEYITKPFKTSDLALVVERTYWRVLSAQQTTAAK